MSTIVTTATTSDLIVRQIVVTLTDEQIKNAPTTFPEIIPAPGVGKINIVLGAVFSLDPTAGDYTNRDAGIGATLTYQGVSDAVNYLPSSFFNYKKLSVVGAVSYPNADLGENEATSSNTAVYENTPISFIIYNGSAGNLTGGHPDNTLKVAAQYVVFDL